MLKETLTKVNTWDLKGLMRDKGITQAKLARKMSVSRQWLNEVLNKDIENLRVKDVREVLKHLGYTLELTII